MLTEDKHEIPFGARRSGIKSWTFGLVSHSGDGGTFAQSTRRTKPPLCGASSIMQPPGARIELQQFCVGFPWYYTVNGLQSYYTPIHLA